MTGSPPKDGSKYLKIFNESMKLFEDYYLKDTSFILRNEISIADLMAVTEFTQLEVWLFLCHLFWNILYILNMYQQKQSKKTEV